MGLISPTAAMWPTFIAQEMNLYQHYGLDPQFIFVGAVAACAQQLVAGSLDVGEVSSTQTIETVQGGGALRFFLEEAVNAPYAFVAQKPYKTYADLKGKLLMIGGPSDITVIFTQRMLASGGVTMSDVDFTYAGATSDRYAALLSGSIAGTILAPPFSFRAVAQGYNLLGRLADVMPPFPFVGWAATDGYARAHGDILTDFCRAHLRATRWLVDPANKAKAIDILIRRSNANPDDAAKSYPEMITVGKAFSTSGATTPQFFATVINVLAQLKVLQPPLPPPTNFYDNRYVDRANAELAHEST